MSTEPSKHILPATSNDNERSVWLLPDSDEPGSRLRLDIEMGDNAFLSQEETLPEQASNPGARRVEVIERIELTRDRAEWLHAALGELLAADKEWL